ncbi:NAD-dependent DNA ligase LigA [Anaerofustis stercorihominis]|uniref:NAD-dependent DNA ligase LigA n=1 Tax=Anaerofustis TaxID=264995 RepID=UPI001107397C|nr:NAD-dependent DNA ligase LigA [Anaerofustis stercorihominis]MCO8193755.1 NAD-dependent DNA ligase LigA [Anaerofustis sp. NSJ-163]
MDAKKEIEQLTEELLEHNRKYYEEDNPSISDYEYDMLLRKLMKLEEEYPEYKKEYSPTDRVGGKALDGFEKVKHEYKQLSLANAFSFDELLEFDNRVKKEIENPVYTLENKFDGLTIVLTYENGILKTGATRGDGEVGEDVTLNVKTIKTIPLKLNKDVNLTVRGEVLIYKDNFEKINKQREKDGESLFANPRNMAAGSIRQLDSKVAAKRDLDCFIFNLEHIDEVELSSHSESLDYLKTLGFKVSEYKKFSNINEIFKALNEKEEERKKLPYEIDGAVIKLDNLRDREVLGSTNKNPRWAIAYKFSETKVKTLLKDIIVNVGRTGTLTPVAILEGVNIDGSFVSRATLHNEDYIKDNDIRIGDKVIVKKAGEIIPQVVSSVKEERNGEEIIFEMPKTCPVCGHEVVREEGISAIKCVNIDCPAKISREIIHFASRDAMNIDTLGERVLENLIEADLIQDVSDIYRLKDKKEQIEQMEKMGEKSVLNMIEAIEKSKENSLEDLIFALSINLVGKQGAKLLAKEFKSMDNLMNATYDDLISINEIGDKMANEIIKFFNNEKKISLINKLKSLGVNMEYINEENEDLKFEGMTFVLTGTLSKYKRNDAKKIIESYGGKVSSSVSKKTTYVLAGENAGSKEEKAKTLGIKIISEDDFEKMI